MEQQAGKMHWIPLPKQKLLIENPAFETLWGGAKGGGKTLALLAIARNYHRRSLLLRRTFPQLEGSMIDKSKEFFKNKDFYNVGMHVWRFPDGRLIRFGHVERPENAQDYDGQEYDLIGFDQLEQFEKPTYDHIITIARTPVAGQRVRIINTANPFGENIDWLIERWRCWVDPQAENRAQPGEIRWFATIENKDVQRENSEPFRFHNELIYPKSRTYIPALPTENPHLDEGYISLLQQLPEPFKSQALYGEWNAGTTDDPYQIIPSLWIKIAMERWTETNPYPKERPIFSMDTAHGGEDRTIISKICGQWFDRLIVYRGVDTPNGEAAANLLKKEMIEGGVAVVDAVGYGADAYGMLRISLPSVLPFNGATRTTNKDRSGQWKFKNLITEAYWKLREDLDPTSGRAIALPPDDELKTELSARRYKFEKDFILAEPKEHLKDRIGRSPDKADAVVMGWYLGSPSAQPSIALKINREYEIG